MLCCRVFPLLLLIRTDQNQNTCGNVSKISVNQSLKGSMLQNFYVRRAMKCIVTFSLALSALYKINFSLRYVKLLVSFGSACKSLEIDGWVEFDQVSVVFSHHIIYLLLVKLHDCSCETSFQLLIDINLGNVSLGVSILIIVYQWKQW